MAFFSVFVLKNPRNFFVEFLPAFFRFFTLCDGVLWLLNDLIPGATDLVQYLHKNNIRTYFISNNSTKTTSEYLEKFKKLNFGVEISPDNVISAAKVTAKRCKDLKLEKVFVLGAKAIDYELSQYGIETVRHEEQESDK